MSCAAKVGLHFLQMFIGGNLSSKFVNIEHVCTAAHDCALHIRHKVCLAQETCVGVAKAKVVGPKVKRRPPKVGCQ